MTGEAQDFPLAERPLLRPVEAIPVEDQGQRYVWLRDPGDPELPPIGLAEPAIAVLRLLDGSRTTEEVARTLSPADGPALSGEVRQFLRGLDEAGYLEGPRAEARRRARLAQFRARAVRPAVHAGGAYPDGLLELPQFLAAGYLHPDGPGALPGRRVPGTGVPRGLIAPHVDLHRGAPTYSWAYRALAEAEPADLYLVLGTCHVPVEGSFAATTRPYDTPLGAVPTDVPFVERVQRLWGQDLLRGEFAHAAEHSIEFQAVYLRSLGLAGESAAPIVPILCDSLHSLVLPPFSPRDVALVADFLAALRQAIAEDGRRVTVIAAVDLAHVGPRFGDAWSVDGARLAGIETADRESLELAAAGDAEGFFQHVMRDGDARRICGFTPIYLLTELMADRGATGDLLRYTQWAAEDGSSSVTFASLIFR